MHTDLSCTICIIKECVFSFVVVKSPLYAYQATLFYFSLFLQSQYILLHFRLLIKKGQSHVEIYQYYCVALAIDVFLQVHYSCFIYLCGFSLGVYMFKTYFFIFIYVHLCVSYCYGHVSLVKGVLCLKDCLSAFHFSCCLL